jgi:serine phosphatase RsbU (regulator of sigma subunit)
MIARPDQRQRVFRAGSERADEALQALAEAAAGAAAASELGDALQSVADGAALAALAEVVVIRIADESGQVRAAAVSSTSSAVAAELEGTHYRAGRLARDEIDALADLPDPVARAAQRFGATAVVQVPVVVDDDVRGSLELLRSGLPFDDAERRAARLASAQAALALRAFAPDRSLHLERGALLGLVGDALGAGDDERETARQVVRLAAQATGAVACLVWLSAGTGPLTLAAAEGLDAAGVLEPAAAAAAGRALAGHAPVILEPSGDLAAVAGVSAAFQLGQPPIGVLQLMFSDDAEPPEEELALLASFAVRAAHALRSSIDSKAVATELDRTRALLAVLGQAISQLSLAHTLETSVARIAELLAVERLAVYLREGDTLQVAAGVGLRGPHLRVAERLLELSLGPLRGRGIVGLANARTDPRLAGVSGAAAEAGIEGVVCVPLLAGDVAIGLLAVFPEPGRSLNENESALLRALAAQLAVVVQNAQLHEAAKRLGDANERALHSERAAAQELGALYEISRSFAQSLSLEATREAVARTVTEVLDVDLALISAPDERRDQLVPLTLHVRDPLVADAVELIVRRPLPFGAQAIQRLFRLAEPFELTHATVSRLGSPATALLPFLERGWSGAVVPIATPAEVLAALTLLSFQPDDPLTADKIERAQAIAGQAALAIDNARLYQQQKEFADTMQRSLLPRSVPELRGLEIGDAYQSSSRVEVGGDVYDFLDLGDEQLAVVLGDVTGHGIGAAADMAMAKFVFRSLAREHPRPAEFLGVANDVVFGEIARGKFITMVYLLVDAASGEIAGAGAGHPPPRLVDAAGAVRALDVHGLVLGIEAGERYEEIRAPLEPGGAVVLYTDGVLEARHEGELYGFERLDAVVSAGRHLSARDLAETVLADCREFAQNELSDDCAVVVIKRT